MYQRSSVLIVDDEAGMLETLADIFEAEGYQVETAKTGHEALRKARSQLFNLVLLDIKLPDTDGITLLKALSQLRPEIMAIMITGYASIETAVAALGEGAFAYIMKPLAMDEVLVTVKQALEQQRLAQENKRLLADLQAMNAIASVVSQSLDLDQVLRDALATLSEILAVEAGEIFLLDETSGDMVLVAQQGRVAEVFPREAQFKADEGIAGLMAKNEKPQIVETKPGDAKKIRKRNGRRRSSILVGIPLRARDRTVGIMEIACRGRGPLTREDLDLLGALGGQIGMAAENARLFVETRHQAAELSTEKDLAQTVSSHLRSVLDSIESAILMVDHNSVIGMVNKRFGELFEVSPSQLVGRDFKEVVDSEMKGLFEDPDQFQRSVLWLDAHPDERVEEELVMVKPEPKTLRRYAGPVYGESQNITGRIEVYTDVSERRQMERQIQESDKLAALGELIAGVAHEINNPLTGIIGFSELLLGAEASAEVKQDLERINAEALRCQRIIQNLLSFARRHKPEKLPVSLNEIVEGTLALLEYRLKVDNIAVIKELDSALPPAMADPHQMGQVFLNIISNAYQAMVADAGSGQLTIRSRPHQGMARIEFSDTGPGIPREHLSRIFDPFFTTKEVGRGTGLGLSVSYGIIKEHEGNIFVESSSGKRTTIVVELPALVDQMAEIIPRDTKEKGGTPLAKHVLMVDDEETILALFSRALAPMGHRVDTAASAEDAIEKLRHHSYDLIVADLKMPGRNGQWLYEQVKGADPQMARRFVFTTGDVVNPDTRAFIEETGRPYLAKPFTLDKLQCILRDG